MTLNKFIGTLFKTLKSYGGTRLVPTTPSLRIHSHHPKNRF